ncbi:MAG: hypothetical protein OEW05_02470 [Candidatus Aminicenantes bacterium]|nr:hypothetical protein [Candidatus Aminicenantes bacterium]
MRKAIIGSAMIAVLLVSLVSGQQATQVPPPVKIRKRPVPIPLPRINNVKLYCGGMPCAELEIIGSNFGATQGSRVVFIDGAAVTDPSRYMAWSNTSISMFIPPASVIFWDHEYHFAVGSGSNVLSNTYPVRFLINIDGLKPASGAPGSEFTIYTFSAGASQGTKVLKLGSHTITDIVSWVGDAVKAQVRVRVPAIPPGEYDFYFQKGADVISVRAKFIVL